MRKANILLCVTLVTLATALGGCADQSASRAGQISTPSDVHTMPDGTVMKGSDMAVGLSSPSPAAKMICTDEAAHSVQSSLDLSSVPRSTHSWKALTYTCSYPVGNGRLVLSVKDLDSPSQGRAWFDATRAGLVGAKAITGMANFGFPAVETTSGKVAFLKDSKTLVVDASAVPQAAIPKGSTRQSIAYTVASGIIACWSK